MTDEELVELRAACPRLTIRDHGQSLEVFVERHPDDELRAQLARAVLHPTTATYRRLSLDGSGGPAETDFAWARGAQLLHERADRVAHLDELWIGSTGHRRRGGIRMPPGEELPRGTFEVGSAWGSRLRARLGRMLRFKKRPGHPDL